VVKVLFLEVFAYFTYSEVYMQEIVNQESLILEGRNRLLMTGVSSVDGFSDEQLKLTANGSKVHILGQNIKISSFNKETGKLSADGVFNSIKFDVKKEPILKRLFK